MKTTIRTLTLLTVLSLSAPLQANAAHLKVQNGNYDPFAAKPLDEALTHFDGLQKKLRNSKARALRQAYEAFRSKKTAKARSLAGPIIGDSIFSDYASWIVASAFQEESENLADTNKLKETAASAREAFRNFEVVLNADPYSPLSKLAPRQLGEAELLLAFATSPTKESVHHFESALERLSNTNGLVVVLPDEVESFARACSKHPTELCPAWIMHLTERISHESEEFEAIAKLFPAIETRPKAPQPAMHGTQTYHSPDLDIAAFDDALISYNGEKWDESVGKLQKFVDEYPKSGFRFRARYWLAQSLLHKKKRDEAKKIFESLQQDSPLSYYGLLSAIASDSPLAKQIDNAFPLASERDLSLNAQELYHLHRAEVLLTAQANDLAGMELKELKPKLTHSSPFLMYLAGLNFRAQNYPTLFVVLTELLQRNYPGIASNIGLQMIFPVVHLTEIRKHAELNGLDPTLVLSLIKQESAFDVRATSSTGASGLMQLMYFTAIETVPGISRTALLEPEQNIKTGARYLGKLLTKYHGNIVLALAGYNAGPAATDRWVKEGIKQKSGMLEFIESIPYKETREYVSSIIRNYFWYSKTLGIDEPKSLRFFWKPYEGLSLEIGGPDISVPPPAPAVSVTPASSAVPTTAADSPTPAGPDVPTTPIAPAVSASPAVPQQE